MQETILFRGSVPLRRCCGRTGTMLRKTWPRSVSSTNSQQRNFTFHTATSPLHNCLPSLTQCASQDLLPFQMDMICKRFNSTSIQQHSDMQVESVSTDQEMREKMGDAARKAAQRSHEETLKSGSQSEKGSGRETSLQSEDIKDPEIIFRSVVKKLESKYGRENMVFPKEVYYLVAPPGAGKGTMSATIMRDRGLTSPPVVVSDLLNTPEMQKLKDMGILINDRIVVELLLETLLDKEYKTGVIVDGFPRTVVQAQIVSLLYDYMMDLRKEFLSRSQIPPAGERVTNVPPLKFRRPVFRIVVLYVDEDVSVQRQLARGKRIEERNRQYQETGHGSYEEIRKTDISVDAAKRRYQSFAKNVFESLQVLKQKFPYNFIDANCTVEQVEKKMHKELEYQSSLELGPDTFSSVSEILPAEKLTEHARQYLVQRLDRYQMRHTALFKKVINIIKSKFMHILERQALSGVAIIRSEDPIFEDPLALNILLDVLTERGYTVILDVMKTTVPVRGDDDKIVYKLQRTFHFEIRFKRPQIRGGLQ